MSNETTDTATPTDITRACELLEHALADGGKIHAFLSGGGLRVVRLEKAKKLLAYGEHPYIEDAIVHLAEDFVAGGRPYDKVYGPNGIHEGYWTGSSSPSGPLDAWVRQGHTFDAYASRSRYAVKLLGSQHQEMPDGVLARAMAGETVIWEARGYTFESGPTRFPNGEAACSTSVLKSPPGGDNGKAFYYRVAKTGLSETLKRAFELALTADPVQQPGLGL